MTILSFVIEPQFFVSVLNRSGNSYFKTGATHTHIWCKAPLISYIWNTVIICTEMFIGTRFFFRKASFSVHELLKIDFILNQLSHEYIIYGHTLIKIQTDKWLAFTHVYLHTSSIPHHRTLLQGSKMLDQVYYWDVLLITYWSAIRICSAPMLYLPEWMDRYCIIFLSEITFQVRVCSHIQDISVVH